MAKHITILKNSLILFFFILAMSQIVISQRCGCARNMCCSRWGYCGTTDAYCGAGCQAGPCKSAPSGGLDSGPRGSLASIVTPAFFNSIMSKTSSACSGKRFYTRQAFITAATSFSQYKGTVAKREVAAMLAQFTHESGHFCYIEEIGGASRNYCDRSNKQYPCAPGKKYFGRGPIQITWNYNYGAAGKALGLNLLGRPELVSSDPVVAFKTALWFWTRNVRPVMSRGFGATTRAINGGECNGGRPSAVQARIDYYKEYCRKLGVSPGANLSC